MSQPIKLLLDECLGGVLLVDIKTTLAWDSPPPIIHHISEHFKLGEIDPVWIPRIADEGWIILTADRGRKGRAKLPAICLSCNVTHILMSGAVHQMKQHEKAFGIIGLWDDIKKCADAPKGSRFIMRLNARRKFILQQVIIQQKPSGDKI